MIDSLEGVHKLGYIHRDIKPVRLTIVKLNVKVHHFFVSFINNKNLLMIFFSF